MTKTATGSSSLTLRLLGGAFLLQAIGSAISGLVLAAVDLLANSAPDDMAETMADIAANEWQLRASILGEMVTAGGIIALGMMLSTRFCGVRARTWPGSLLGCTWSRRRCWRSGRCWCSSCGGPATKPPPGAHPMSWSTEGPRCMSRRPSRTHCTPSSLAAGVTIFYVLFPRSDLLPRPLIGLGLIAAPLALVSQVLVVFRVDVPLILYLSNLPCELGAGLWLVLDARAAAVDP